MNRTSLKVDCKNCFGLCCVALFFSAQDGFPIDKKVGQPCKNLNSDFCCNVHKNLQQFGYKGCIAYDCFGAGQKVAQVTFHGCDWAAYPDSQKQMFEAFLIMRQLHELLWYLTEAVSWKEAYDLHEKINSMIQVTEEYTNLNPDDLLKMDLDKHWDDVNALLIQTSKLVRGQMDEELKLPFQYKKTFSGKADLFTKNLRKTNLSRANLRGACLIAADLRGLDLSRTDFIGADFRDANLRGADLSESMFLTQSQINVARGDSNTKLPPSLVRPIHW